MPLFIDDLQMLDLTSIGQFHQIYTQFQAGARRLKSMPPINIDPQEPYLFIHQMETACLSADDPTVSMIGIDDMTTCSSFILRHTGSRATGAGHFDGHDTERGVNDIINGVLELTRDWARRNNILNFELDINNRFEVHLIGGFEDARCISVDALGQLFECLQRATIDLHLKTACIYEQNTYYHDSIPLPCISSLICDVKTGEIVPASFSFQGPLEEIRRLRFSMKPPIQMNSIYSSKSKILEIKPYDWTFTNDQIQQLLGLNTNSFLYYWSTSPLAEKPSFVPSTKAALKFLLDHRESLFCSGRSYRFIRHSGQWKLVE